MCGIAGILNMASGKPVCESAISRMLAMIRHRGPDEFGIYLDRMLGLGNARLSIIDLSGGQQPISNEDGNLWIVFNGEIFNHLELRPELESRGHCFATHSDTEVLLHLYEEYGPQCLDRLNGQFAFAIWNVQEQTLFLARDRMGVRPLFYTLAGGNLVFASEIKAILSAVRVRAELCPEVLDEVFTFWGPLSARTVFRGIREIPPGHYALASAGKMTVKSYWQPSFPSLPLRKDGAATDKTFETYLDEFSELLIDAARIRLRADVPVGAYLSGGLDSSIIASIIRNFTQNRLDTFSIAFSDVAFDESHFQRQMAQFLGTEHQVVHATHDEIARIFPEVVWHTEVPLMRTAPAPMFLLSKLVRDSGYKVVLTGEGADELLAGYDIFKEAKIRRFWGRQPDSSRRPLLLRRLYPDIAGLSKNNISFLAGFFREGVADFDARDYSHAIRWRNNRRSCRFFSKRIAAELASRSTRAVERVFYPPQLPSWGPLERAQFLELSIFLPQYLLSSQGDRVAMAHSIEGRFPFLDHRIVEFCNRLPSRLKLRGLTEKYLLKKLGQKWLPKEIWQRSKRPYRAPIHQSFFHKAAPDYVDELLSPEMLKKTGTFDPVAVGHLVRKARNTGHLGEADEMALVGILSTQLIQHQFIDNFKMASPLSANERVRVRIGCGTWPDKA